MANPTVAGADVRPIPGAERIIALDAQRGFALLGILLVNVSGFIGIRALGAEVVAVKTALGADPTDTQRVKMLQRIYQQQLNPINTTHRSPWQQIDAGQTEVVYESDPLGTGSMPSCSSQLASWWKNRTDVGGQQ